MNLLSHKSSSKSLTKGDQRGRSDGQDAAAAGRASSESKPGFLHRLRKSSLSRERDSPKEAGSGAGRPQEVSFDEEANKGFSFHYQQAREHPDHEADGDYRPTMSPSPQSTVLVRNWPRRTLPK